MSLNEYDEYRGSDCASIQLLSTEVNIKKV